MAASGASRCSPSTATSTPPSRPSGSSTARFVVLTVARHDPLGYDIRAELFGSGDSDQRRASGRGRRCAPSSPACRRRPARPGPTSSTGSSPPTRPSSPSSSGSREGHVPSPCVARDGRRGPPDRGGRDPVTPRAPTGATRGDPRLRPATAAGERRWRGRAAGSREVPSRDRTEIRGTAASVRTIRAARAARQGRAARSMSRRRTRDGLRRSVALFAAPRVSSLAPWQRRDVGRRGRGGRALDGALVKRSDIKIEVVTHGQAIDGFWGVVRNGVKAGAADMGVTVNYSAPAPESDMPGMSALIDAAVAKKPSGLVVSIPNPDALSPSIKKAIEAGHPGRLDELGLGRLQGASASRPTSARPSSRPASAPASASRPPASRTPSASTRKSATRR